MSKSYWVWGGLGGSWVVDTDWSLGKVVLSDLSTDSSSAIFDRVEGSKADGFLVWFFFGGNLRVSRSEGEVVWEISEFARLLLDRMW